MEKSIKKDSFSHLLKNISNPFFENIAYVRAPIKEYLTVSALLFDIMKYYQDNTILSNEEKINVLSYFKKLIEIKKINYNLIENLGGYHLKMSLSNIQKEVFDHLKEILQSFILFPNDIKVSISRAIHISIDKSIDLLNKNSEGSKFSNFDQLESYLDYKSGTLGELLTSIFYYSSEHILYKELLDSNAKSLGSIIEYLSITKNFKIDFKNNIVYYPLELFNKYDLSLEGFADKNKNSLYILKEMILRVHMKQKAGMNYITDLSFHEKSIRLFCLWPIFYSLEVLIETIKNQNSFYEGKIIDIPSNKKSLIHLILRLIANSNILVFLYFNYKSYKLNQYLKQ